MNLWIRPDSPNEGSYQCKQLIWTREGLGSRIRTLPKTGVGTKPWAVYRGRYNDSMRRAGITLFFALALFASAAPLAHAVNLPLLNPDFAIVPDAHMMDPTGCPPGAPLSYGAVLQLIQNLVNAAVSIGVLAFVIVIAYAGAMFMLNPTNPESRSKARSMLINVVVGLVIVLAAWLVVDFIMKVLYAGNNGSTEFGPWNEILSPDSNESLWCIEVSDIHRIPGLGGALYTGALGGTGGGGAGGGTSGAPTPGGGARSGACTVPSGGPCSLATLSNSCFSSHATAAAQICTGESGANPNRVSGDRNPVYGKTADGHPFAIGLFQINITNSFNHQVNGQNCSAAFSGACQGRNMNQSTGRCSVTVTNLPLYNACVAAAQDAAINTAAACTLNNGGAGGWRRWEAHTRCGL